MTIANDPLMIHYVHDMQRALRFYRDVFEVDATFESPGWSTLDFGSITLALHILSPQTPESVLPHAGISFRVEQIEPVQARIERGGGRLVTLREPNEHVPVRVASFLDSEGNSFDLRQDAAG
ncbi:MAG: VOC family protein [Pseudomonadota bacterium]